MSPRRRFVLAPEDAPILFAACALPWAFGGASLWATRIAGLLLAAGVATALLRRGSSAIPVPRGWLVPAALLGAFAFLQTVPLPPGVIRALSPGAADVFTEAFPGWPATAPELPALETAALDALGGNDSSHPAEGDPVRVEPSPPVTSSSWRALSLAPDATREAAFWYLALLLATMTVVPRLQDRAARSAYRTILFMLFVALALFGLAQAATWNGKMFWVSQQPGRPFGPYLNGTHFAGVMELACPWIGGYLATRVRREGLSAWRSPRGLVAAAGLGVCLAAGIAAQSKMGVILIGTSLVILLVVSVPSGRKRWAAFGASAVAGAVATVMLAAGPLGERFRSQLDESGGALDVDRLAAWSACIPMWNDFPWVGSGFGAFRYVFPRYIPAGETQGWLQAHNDWLEVALGGGLVAALLLVAVLTGFVRRAARAFHDLDHRGERSERRGLLLGLGALSAHALVDFNHQIPANALLFVLAASIAATPARDGSGRPA